MRTVTIQHGQISQADIPVNHDMIEFGQITCPNEKGVIYIIKLSADNTSNDYMRGNWPNKSVFFYNGIINNKFALKASAGKRIQLFFDVEFISNTDPLIKKEVLNGLNIVLSIRTYTRNN